MEAQTSGVRGRIGEVISAGKLKNPAIIRSHGGRPRAVEAGEVHIDIAFLAAATSDCCGNAKGTGGIGTEKFFGVSLADEKDVIYIVASGKEKAAIMNAINKEAGPSTKAGAISFSLPVSDVAGLRRLDDE